MSTVIEPDAADVAVPLREQMKRITRERLEEAAVKMLEKHGYRAMTVEQIAKAAGTTRTTFYQYFASKAQLIPFIQEKYIAPEMLAVCRGLDTLKKPTPVAIRNWVTEYAKAWLKVQIFLNAYAEAAVESEEVARSAMKESAKITATMVNIINRYQPAEHDKVRTTLDILLAMTASVMMSVQAAAEDPAKSALLDRVAEIWWASLFALPTVMGS